MPGTEVAEAAWPCPQPELAGPGLTLVAFQVSSIFPVQGGWEAVKSRLSCMFPHGLTRGRPKSIHSETGSGLFTKCLPSSGRKSLPARWFFIFLFQLFLGSWFGNSQGLLVTRSGPSPARLLGEKTDTAFPEGTLTLVCMAFDLAVPLLGIYPKK